MGGGNAEKDATGGNSGQRHEQGGQESKSSSERERQDNQQDRQDGRHVQQEHSSCPPMHREPESLYPFIVWFDVRTRNMQDDLLRRRFFDVPQVAHFNPNTRSRFLDALIPADEAGSSFVFHVNPDKNRVECELNLGREGFFRPEDVELNVMDRNVELVARREMKSEDKYTLREVRRILTVPQTADIEKLNAEMNPNGRIILSAPLLEPLEKRSNGPAEIKINKK